MPLTSTRSFNRFFPARLMPSRPRFRIKCVNRTGYSAVHQKIRFIGGLNADDSAWKLSQEKAVRLITDVPGHDKAGSEACSGQPSAIFASPRLIVSASI